jgi:DNA-binding beta-propeller fold protein YncE
LCGESSGLALRAGDRILVTNRFANRISLWKAADLTPLGFVSTGNGTQPTGAGSDGLNFWITLQGTNKLARF